MSGDKTIESWDLTYASSGRIEEKERRPGNYEQIELRSDRTTMNCGATDESYEVIDVISGVTFVTFGVTGVMPDGSRQVSTKHGER